MSAALSFKISTISSRLPGRSVIFAINPHIPLASCEPARMGVSATAPRYSKNVRRSICTCQIYACRFGDGMTSEWIVGKPQVIGGGAFVWRFFTGRLNAKLDIYGEAK